MPGQSDEPDEALELLQRAYSGEPDVGVRSDRFTIPDRRPRQPLDILKFLRRLVKRAGPRRQGKPPPVDEEELGLEPRIISADAFGEADVACAVVYDRHTKQPLQVYVSDAVDEHEFRNVYAHALGHAIDQAAGEIPVDGLDEELRRNYSTLRKSVEHPSLTVTPELMGHDAENVPRELMAEAIRAYMANPRYVKADFPRTAAVIRQHVNRHPRLSRIIQFSSVAALIGAGAVAVGGRTEIAIALLASI